MKVIEIIKLIIKKNSGVKLLLTIMQPLTIIFGVILFSLLRVPTTSLTINGETFYNVINFITQVKAVLISSLVVLAPLLSLSGLAIVDKYDSDVKHIKLQEFNDLIVKTQEELSKVEGFVKTPRPDLVEKNIVKKLGSISTPLRTYYSLENEVDEAMVRRYRR